MTVKPYESTRLFGNKAAKPADPSKPYETPKLFGKKETTDSGAEERINAAVAHLREKHGNGADAKIRAMSTANLIILGERLMREAKNERPEDKADSGGVKPYVPRTFSFAKKGA